MNSSAYEQFFLQPSDPWHRRYEALRALFVEQQSLEAVAERFALRYQTVANWASDFRRQYDTDSLPPFSFNHYGDDPVHR